MNYKIIRIVIAISILIFFRYITIAGVNFQMGHMLATLNGEGGYGSSTYHTTVFAFIYSLLFPALYLKMEAIKRTRLAIAKLLLTTIIWYSLLFTALYIGISIIAQLIILDFNFLIEQKFFFIMSFYAFGCFIYYVFIGMTFYNLYLFSSKRTVAYLFTIIVGISLDFLRKSININSLLKNFNLFGEFYLGNRFDWVEYTLVLMSNIAIIIALYMLICVQLKRKDILN